MKKKIMGGKTDIFMRHYTLLDFICLSNTGIVHVQKNCILNEELYSIYTKAWFQKKHSIRLFQNNTHNTDNGQTVKNETKQNKKILFKYY